jgi:hypothetical protein
MTSRLSLPVVELEEGDGGEPDVAEAAVPGMGAHAHFDPLVRQRGRQHLNRDGNFMGARNQVGIGLSYRPPAYVAWLINSRLGSWNLFLAP